MSALVQIGDRFTDAEGKTLVVVDRFHTNQKWAYWVTQNYHSDVANLVTSTVFRRTTDPGNSQSDRLGWNVKQYGGRPWPASGAALCLASELDVTTNEFGLVMP